MPTPDEAKEVEAKYATTLAAQEAARNSLHLSPLAKSNPTIDAAITYYKTSRVLALSLGPATPEGRKAAQGHKDAHDELARLLRHRGGFYAAKDGMRYVYTPEDNSFRSFHYKARKPMSVVKKK